MDLQTAFYTLGIIYMVLGIVILLGIGIGMMYIVRKISELQKTITETVNSIASHPGEVAADVGSALVKSAYKKAKKIVEEKT